MLLKLAGIIFLSVGGAMIGGIKALQLSKRVAVLSGLYEAVTVFENEINFKVAPISEAFESAAERDISGVFSDALPFVFEKGASASLGDAIKLKKLPKEESGALLSFAKGLSAQDKEAQIKNARLAALRIKEIEEKAAKRCDKLFSLYCTVGILGGAAGGIMLL